jgi:hypothetical protein
MKSRPCPKIGGSGFQTSASQKLSKIWLRNSTFSTPMLRNSAAGLEIGFPAGMSAGSWSGKPQIGPAAARRPAEPILMPSRIESGRNPPRKQEAILRNIEYKTRAHPFYVNARGDADSKGSHTSNFAGGGSAKHRARKLNLGTREQ